MVAGVREPFGMEGPVHQVDREQPAEEHHLVHEEGPHPEAGGFTLLLGVVEVMRDVGGGMDDGVSQRLPPWGTRARARRARSRTPRSSRRGCAGSSRWAAGTRSATRGPSPTTGCLTPVPRCGATRG